MEHAVFKIKYNQDYFTKLIEISIVDKIYEFDYYQVIILIFCFAPDRNVVYEFFEWPSYIGELHVSVHVLFNNVNSFHISLFP